MASTRRNWSADEDEMLKGAVAHAQLLSDVIPWSDIAKQVPGRSNRDCRKRWVNTLASAANTGPWSPSEDERLAEAVRREGPRWTKVSATVRTRSGDQCAKHWTQTSNPQIDRGEWSKDEDKRLVQAFQAHGPNWSYISSFYFPSRSALASKNRFSCIARKHKSVASLRTPGASSPQSDSSASIAATATSESVGSDAGRDSATSPADGLDGASEAMAVTRDADATRASGRRPARSTTDEPSPEGKATVDSSPWWNESLVMDDLVFPPCSPLPHADTGHGVVRAQQTPSSAPLGTSLPTAVGIQDGINWTDEMDFVAGPSAARPSNWSASNPEAPIDATESPAFFAQLHTPSSSAGTAAAFRSSASSQGQSPRHGSDQSSQGRGDQSTAKPASIKHITIHATCTEGQLAYLMQAAVSHSISWEMTSD